MEESERKCQAGCAEPIIGIEAKKIFEVWREGADQQSRKDEREASKREGGSTVC